MIKLIFKIKKKIAIFVGFVGANVIVAIIEGIFKEKILRDFVQEIDFKVNNDIAVVSDFDPAWNFEEISINRLIENIVLVFLNVQTFSVVVLKKVLMNGLSCEVPIDSITILNEVENFGISQNISLEV